MCTTCTRALLTTLLEYATRHGHGVKKFILELEPGSVVADVGKTLIQFVWFHHLSASNYEIIMLGQMTCIYYCTSPGHNYLNTQL